MCSRSGIVSFKTSICKKASPNEGCALQDCAYNQKASYAPQEANNQGLAKKRNLQDLPSKPCQAKHMMVECEQCGQWFYYKCVNNGNHKEAEEMVFSCPDTC